MIEILLALTCLNSSDIACSTAASAYYQQSGIQDIVTAKSQKLATENPNLSRVIVTAAAATQGQVLITLSRTENLTLNTKSNIIGYGVTF